MPFESMSRDAERGRMIKKETNNLDAYDDLLRGRELFVKFTTVRENSDDDRITI